MRRLIKLRWIAALLAALLVAWGALAGVYTALQDHSQALLIERIAQTRPPERDFPRDPQAENVQQTITGASHVLTYTTSADIGEINEFYTQALEHADWQCDPLGRYHAEVRCLWSGEADHLPWDLYLKRQLTMLPGGSQVQIQWGRIVNLHRLPLYPGGRVTERTSSGCRDADLALGAGFCAPSTHVYLTEASITQLTAFYRDIFAFCGSDWNDAVISS